MWVKLSIYTNQKIYENSFCGATNEKESLLNVVVEQTLIVRYRLKSLSARDILLDNTSL